MNGKDYTNKMSKIQDLTVREHTARLQSLIGKTVSYLSAETGAVIEGKLERISGETAIISNGWANLWEVVETEKYGTIEHNGKTIILDDYPVQTSRLMNEYGSDLQYQGGGKTYMDEWAASGHYENGDQVRVFWHFEIERNSETLPEDYDWDNIHSVKND